MRQVHDLEFGFTLVEVLLAVMIASMAMVAVTGTFLTTLQTRDEIESLSTSTDAGQRILTLIERDVRGLWHHNVENNAVLIGRDTDIVGFDADRLNLLTTTDSIGGVLDESNTLVHPSVCEVGYWLRPNPDIPGLLELWRREDPMVDNELETEGQFQLVCDRVRSFNITYYASLGYEAEPIEEWDSTESDALPRRMKIEFTVDRKLANRNVVSNAEINDFDHARKEYVRHFVFDRRFAEILRPGVAMIPMIPRRPVEDPEGPIGGGGGGEGGGPGGNGGRGGDGAGGGPAGPGGVGNDGGGLGDDAGGSRRGGQRGGGRGGEGGNLGDLGDLLRGGRGGGGGGLFGGGGR